MSYVSLYKADNTKFNFYIGSVTPRGAYADNVRNYYSATNTMPSGTVNGVTIPSQSGHVDWGWNPLTPVINQAGTNIVDLLNLTANTTLRLYTQPNQGGSIFTFYASPGNKNIKRINIQCGSKYINFDCGSSLDAMNASQIFFCWVDGMGLTPYDNLSIFFKSTGAGFSDHYGLHFGGTKGLNVIFTNATSGTLQQRFDSGSLINASSGDKGFRPIGNRTKNVIGGGMISGEKPGYGTDILTQPGAPDESVASAIGTGFVNIYKVDSANLARLGKCLFSGLFAKLNNVFISPMDYIVSLQIFPYEPLTGAAEYIKVLQYTAIAADLSEDSQGTKLTNQFRTIDFGTLTVPEMWESFLDYDATSFELYLPFIGTVDIPVSEVMNGSVNVQYTIDYLTGMCVANVLCTKTVTLSDESVETQYAQHSYQGNCAVTVPLCNESFSGIVGALATAAATCFSGGLGAAAGSLAMAGASGGFKPTIETKGAISSNAGFCAVLQPYISITRPIPAEPDNYQEVIGYPSYIDAILGTCEGLCVCDNIELSGLAGATDSEIARIKQMCKEGVYI